MKRIGFLVAAVLVVAAGAFLLRQGPSTGPEAGRTKPPPQVRVTTATTDLIAEILELTGSVEPYRLARLASPAEGPVASLHAREGDRVSVGTPLLAIGRNEGAAALIASLREEVRKEEDNLRRTRQLVESDALAGEQLDRARSDYERARAQLIRAEESAGDYNLSAPWSGIVSRVLVREGDYVAPRTPLIELYDPSSLVIRAAVPERHATRVQEGLSVAVTLDAYPGRQIQGRIVRVYAYLDERTRTRTFEIELPAELALLPGMFARLRLPLAQVDDAIVIPRDAVMTTPAGPLVVFVVDGGLAQRRIVAPGIEEGARVQILRGIGAGEQVVVAGQERLKDGAAVRVLPADASGEAAEKKPVQRPVPGQGTDRR